MPQHFSLHAIAEKLSLLMSKIKWLVFSDVKIGTRHFKTRFYNIYLLVYFNI